ncbi:MAG TPA: M90 family metallopeptidase [Gemmataceae bacterium]|nr:M90 family metallopeptidase [Gemmataceae bacterium]
MLFSWLKKRRRGKLLTEPFPPAWLDILHNNVAHYRSLTEAEQARLRDDLRIFIAEREWEGCGGLEMTDEIKVTIAAQACLLVLGLNLDMFRHVRTILVYPTAFKVAPEVGILETPGLKAERALLGEANYRGPILLAWDKVLAGGRRLGHDNLVFHEFAHQLDMLDGYADGVPPLKDRKQARRWGRITSAEFEHLRQESDSGMATFLDAYGAIDEGEFFAVTTEYFFNSPVPLRERHPKLYDLFREFYQQDPAARA